MKQFEFGGPVRSVSIRMPASLYKVVRAAGRAAKSSFNRFLVCAIAKGLNIRGFEQGASATPTGGRQGADKTRTGLGGGK